MMHYWNNGWEMGGAVGMSVMMLVFWGAVTWVVVMLVRRSRTGPTETSDEPDPLRTLDRGYAEGDIDTAE